MNYRSIIVLDIAIDKRYIQHELHQSSNPFYDRDANELGVLEILLGTY